MASSVVLPAGFESVEAPGLSGDLSAFLRVQNVYGTNLLPPNPIVIKVLRFRRDASTPPFSDVTISNLQINLSTTPRSPDNLSAVFADNVGTNDMVVFQGTIAVSSPTSASTGAAPFEILIPLTNPFLFDPAQGNLLIDVRNKSGSTVGYIDGANASDDHASRAFNLGNPDSMDATSVDTGAAVVELVYDLPGAPDQLVVPNGYDTTEAPGWSGDLTSVIRVQNVYGSALFPFQPVTITELRFRRDTSISPFTNVTISNLQINLSTTPAQTDALSPVFAQNIGTNDTLVFQGSVAVSSPTPAAPGAAVPFEIAIPLAKPFTYDPSQGNLLVDIRNSSGSGVGMIDQTPSPTDHASRVFTLGTTTAPTADSTDTGASMLELVFKTEPATAALVLPEGYDGVEAPGWSGDLASVIRVQNVYGSNLFPANPIPITELRFRRDGNVAPFTNVTISNLQINLSTTHAQPDGLSPVFAQNPGTNDTVVFQGAVTVSSPTATSTSGPAPFEIVIPLSAPFTYDPSQGNLLVDIRNSSGSGVGMIDQTPSPTDHASRVFTLGTATSPNATYVDTGSAVIQVIYTVTPTNPTPPNTFLVPAGFDTVEAPGFCGDLYAIARVQDMYGSNLFPANPITITELRFRRDASAPPFANVTISNLQINLSTTHVKTGGLSAVFAQNPGKDEMVVFKGAMTVSSPTPTTQTGPAPFEIIIPLSVPFTYSPSLGNLLVDIRNTSGAAAIGWVDGADSPSDNASRAFTLGTATSATAAYLDTGSAVIQMVTSPQLVPKLVYVDYYYTQPPGLAFEFWLIGQPGLNYQIQISSDFSTWTPLKTVTPSSGLTLITDSASGQPGARFYRVQQVP
jgi:hypothetical protein